MKKFLIAVIMMLSFNVYADTIGGNFSTIKNSDVTHTNAFEVYGAKTYTDDIDFTLKGIVKHNNILKDESYALEGGVKYKFLSPETSRYVPWVQPALTYVNPINKGSYFGYVVDGGVDFYANKDIILTPAVSFENSLDGQADKEKYTYGLKAAYLIDAKNAVYARARRENSAGGNIADRFYIGFEYKL